jgi:hypothetical protein
VLGAAKLFLFYNFIDFASSLGFGLGIYGRGYGYAPYGFILFSGSLAACAMGFYSGLAFSYVCKMG